MPIFNESGAADDVSRSAPSDRMNPAVKREFLMMPLADLFFFFLIIIAVFQSDRKHTLGICKQQQQQ